MGCSLAAATSGEDSSVAAFSDNSSLTSATTNGNQMFLQINNLGHNLLGSNSNNSYREDDDDDSLFLHRLYADQQPQPSSFRYKNDTTFQVLLPAGKAGMVLNTPTEGWGPTVYYVKPDCAVANKVQVGDMLLSADGQDCTHMTALEASRLLSKKADNAKRLLVFARKR